MSFDVWWTPTAIASAQGYGWRHVEVVGITTTIDPAGKRAGCVAHWLELAGREGIPVAAGAAASQTTLRLAEPATDGERYWPADIEPAPAPPGAALDLLARSIEQDATVIAIGPLTNLALLGICLPESLRQARIVAMGGWVAPRRRASPLGVLRRTSTCSGTRAPQRSLQRAPTSRWSLSP